MADNKGGPGSLADSIFRALSPNVSIGGYPHQHNDGRGHTYFGNDPRIEQGDKSAPHGHYNPNNGYFRTPNGDHLTNFDGTPKK